MSSDPPLSMILFHLNASCIQAWLLNKYLFFIFEHIINVVKKARKNCCQTFILFYHYVTISFHLGDEVKAMLLVSYKTFFMVSRKIKY